MMWRPRPQIMSWGFSESRGARSVTAPPDLSGGEMPSLSLLPFVFLCCVASSTLGYCYFCHDATSFVQVACDLTFRYVEDMSEANWQGCSLKASVGGSCMYHQSLSACMATQLYHPRGQSSQGDFLCACTGTYSVLCTSSAWDPNKSRFGVAHNWMTVLVDARTTDCLLGLMQLVPIVIVARND